MTTHTKMPPMKPGRFSMMSVAQGGNFGTGFLSDGLTKFAGGIGGSKFSITGKGFGAMFSRVAVAGAIGGVAARISGGRFWSGFQTGAFQRLFKDESHEDGYFARKIGTFKAWASGFSKRYINFVERYAI